MIFVSVLDSLLGLHMISHKEKKYKGAIPVKSIFSITENGKILLNIIVLNLWMLK